MKLNLDAIARRRQRILIDPGFQLRSSGYVAIWALGLGLISSVSIVALFSFFETNLAEQPGGAAHLLQEVREQFSLLFVLFQVGYVVLVFAVTLIFFSHRVIGPVYNLKNTMLRAAQGDWPHEVSFRKGDEFSDLGEGYNVLAQSRRDERNHFVQSVSTVIARMEATAKERGMGHPDFEEGMKELKMLREELSRS